MANNFLTRLSDFNEKYKTDLTFDQIRKTLAEIRNIEAEIGNDNESVANTMGYSKILYETYEQSIFNHLVYDSNLIENPNNVSRYDSDGSQIEFAEHTTRDGFITLPTFNVKDFIEEFEEVFVEYNKNLLDNQDRKAQINRKKYNGLKLDDMVEGLKADSTEMGKDSLVGFWRDSFFEEQITMQSLQNIAQTSFNKLDGAKREAFHPKLYSGERNIKLNLNDLEDYPQEEGHLKALVTAKETIKSVRESRGFWGGLWFAIRHPLMNSDEKTLLADLESKLETVKEMGFPVDEMTGVVNQKGVLSTQIKQADDILKAPVNKEENNLDIEPKKEHIPSLENSFNIRYDEDIIGSDEHKEELYEEIKDIFAKSSFKGAVKTFFMSVAYQPFMQGVKEFCRDFDFSSNSVGVQGAIDSAQKELFLKNFELTEGLGYLNDIKERIIVAQKLTDYAINTFGPKGFFPDNYENLKNEPVISNAENCANLLKSSSVDLDKDSLQSVIEQANKDYSKEQIIVEDANIIKDVKLSNSVKESEQLQKVPEKK